MNMPDVFADHLMWVVLLLALAVGLTFVIFHWRKFDEEGYEKGDAADPERIARDNPPDEWCKSHWANCPPETTKPTKDVVATAPTQDLRPTSL